MAFGIDPLPCPDSAFRRFDPRWKLAGLVILIAAVAALHHGLALLLACGLALGMAALARLPWSWLLARLSPVGLVLALFLGPLPFLLRGPGAEWPLGPLTVSEHGLRLALSIALKAVSLVLLVLVLLASAPLQDTLKAANALHVPGRAVQLLVLTYRYAHVLAEELDRLRTAVRVRGFRGGPNRHTYRTIGHVAGALLVRGYDRADRIAQAMRCRGFDGRYRSLTTFATRACDVLGFLALAAAAAVLLAWDRIAPGTWTG